MSQGFLRNASLRPGSSDFPSYNFEDKFFLYDIEDSRSKTSWQNVELVLYDSAVLFSILLCSAIFPVSIGFNLQEDDDKFFEFSKNGDNGSPQSGRYLKKTCLDTPSEFRVSGCKQESRLIIPLGLGMVRG